MSEEEKVIGEKVMRAKMRVTDVQKFENSDGEKISMTAVARNDAYPDDGSDENNTFARFSPSAEFSVHCYNPNLYGKFAIGDTFYVDFTRAPK